MRIHRFISTIMNNGQVVTVLNRKTVHVNVNIPFSANVAIYSIKIIGFLPSSPSSVSNFFNDHIPASWFASTVIGFSSIKPKNVLKGVLGSIFCKKIFNHTAEWLTARQNPLRKSFRNGMILTSLVSFCKVETRRRNIILIDTQRPASILKCERVSYWWTFVEHRPWRTVLTYQNRNIIVVQFDEFNGRVEGCDIGFSKGLYLLSHRQR